MRANSKTRISHYIKNKHYILYIKTRKQEISYKLSLSFYYFNSLYDKFKLQRTEAHEIVVSVNFYLNKMKKKKNGVS